MRTTVNLDDELLARAQDITGQTERGELLHEALRALIEREAARRLSRLSEACRTQKIFHVVAVSCMILVDTSIWIDLFRGSGPLGEMLRRTEVQTHPFVIGELACGSLPDRPTTLKLLQELPSVRGAGNGEVLFFIEKHNLMARGIGYVDMHLLASAALDACKLLPAINDDTESLMS